MKEILKLLYRFRNFLLFLFLQGICFWLIINHNVYQRITVLTSANSFVGGVLNVQNWVSTRWNLKDENERLVAENARLHAMLSNQIRQNLLDDTLAFAQKDSLTQAQFEKQFSSLDSTQLVSLAQYKLIPANVIKHSWLGKRNFLTIDKGSAQGIKKGMGVITDTGIVGKIEVVSNGYATVRSLLHVDYEVASQIKRNGLLATTKWNGKDYHFADLLHTTTKDIKKGDTVVTYTENILYPEGFTVGYIESVKRSSSQPFNEVALRLATDFSRISFVYVIENSARTELDSLEQITKEPK